MVFFFCKQKTAYDVGLGIPAEPLFRSGTKKRGTECFLVVFNRPINILCRVSLFLSMALCLLLRLFVDRKSGSAGMPRPISYAVFCLKKKTVRRKLSVIHTNLRRCERVLHPRAVRSNGRTL